jgi:threonine dehydrogenase-like Zn-dependent dehydrogenase
LPDELARRQSRLARIQAAKKLLEERARAEAAEEAALRCAEGKSPPTTPPAEAVPDPKDQINFTDPESRIMKASNKGWDQCGNAQAVTNEHQIILAADVVRPEQHTLAGAMVAPGGVIVQVGATAPGTTAVAIAPGVLVTRHASVTGTVYGGDDPAADALRYIELARAGRLDLERLITRRYPFARINDAFSDLRARRNVRGVLLYD